MMLIDMTAHIPLILLSNNLFSTSGFGKINNPWNVKNQNPVYN